MRCNVRGILDVRCEIWGILDVRCDVVGVVHVMTGWCKGALQSKLCSAQCSVQPQQQYPSPGLYTDSWRQSATRIGNDFPLFS